MKTGVADPVFMFGISEVGRIVAEIGLVGCEESRGLAVAALVHPDTAKQAARDRVAIDVAAPLPPGKTLGRERSSAVRVASHIGQKAAGRECPRARPWRGIVWRRLQGFVQPELPFAQLAAVEPEDGQSPGQ